MPPEGPQNTPPALASWRRPTNLRLLRILLIGGAIRREQRMKGKGELLTIPSDKERGPGRSACGGAQFLPASGPVNPRQAGQWPADPRLLGRQSRCQTCQPKSLAEGGLNIRESWAKSLRSLFLTGNRDPAKFRRSSEPSCIIIFPFVRQARLLSSACSVAWRMVGPGGRVLPAAIGG